MLAVNQLREYLTNLARLQPDAVRIIIGHSHGGTIGTYAVNEPSTARVVSGLVCLSSPFFRVTVRNIASTKRALSVALGLAAFGPLVGLEWGAIIGAPILDMFWKARQVEPWLSPWHLLSWIIGMAIFGLLYVAIRLVFFSISAFSNSAREFASEADSSKAARVPLLCFFHPGDEAVWWLRMLGLVDSRLKQIVSPNIPAYSAIACFALIVIMLFQTNIADRIMQIGLENSASALAELPSWLRNSVEFIFSPESWFVGYLKWFATLLLGFVLSGLGVVVFVVVTQTSAAVLGRLTSGGFYSFGFSRHWLTKIEVQPRPTKQGGLRFGCRRVVNLATFAREDYKRTWLRHSQVYHTPEVGRAIGAWIETISMKIKSCSG